MTKQKQQENKIERKCNAEEQNRDPILIKTEVTVNIVCIWYMPARNFYLHSDSWAYLL